MNKTFLSQLDWRFATKSFNPNRHVGDEQLSSILEAIRKAPTSFGLQPFQVRIIANKEKQEKLAAASYGQSQIPTASHVLVFCARTDISSRIDTYIAALAGGDAEKTADLEGFGKMMHQSLDGLAGESAVAWSAKQAYLALGFAMAACAELEIDSCPMEGFDAAAWHAALELPESLRPVVLLPIGFRTIDPDRPKFRFPEEELFVK
jgi:nitroreductase